MDAIKTIPCASLPESLQAWRDIQPMQDPQWDMPWENLRPFFKAAGYELHRRATDDIGAVTISNTETPPALDSFGLYGDRSDFHTYFIPIAPVHAARDIQNRDVIIKVVAKGAEGQNERKILELLNSEPLRSDPANATIPIIEFLEYQGYCFVVMPRYGVSGNYPFLHARECLDFAEQVLEALCFLHRHRIAHLDISFENILVNFYGKMPRKYTHDRMDEPCPRIWPPLEWRSTFPVRYYFMDFGISVRFAEDSPLSNCLALPFPQGRQHRAPETRRTRAFNPFAADVYQTARLFYAWFPDLSNDVPDLMGLLQDMSSYNPSRRTTASEALARLRTLRTSISHEKLNELREQDLVSFKPVPPRSNSLLLRDIVETGNWKLACQFTWWILTTWFNGLGLRLKQKKD